MKDIFNKNNNGYTLLYYKIIKKVKKLANSQFS